MLITFCNNNGTKIGNTFFKHKDIHKKLVITRWSNSKRNRLHLCEQELGNVAGGHQSADVGSDHYLLVGKIRIKLKRTAKKKSVRAYAVENLKECTTAAGFR